ncbi:MAG: hypothetical protein LBI10_02435 [Deltaproteobacteria bacterium]|jgi:flagellar biosynthesis/type III secretory pathway protein FliH|nr:hypothetical protein [Deltaproteobacteria bacterium]
MPDFFEMVYNSPICQRDLEKSLKEREKKGRKEGVEKGRKKGEEKGRK